MTLAEMVRDVAEKRQKYSDSKAIVDARQLAWEEENADVIDALETATNLLSNAEGTLRAAILMAPPEVVEATFGVAIKNIQKLIYDKDAAIKWAISENSPGLLSLKVREFEKAARGDIAKGKTPPCVTVTPEKQATIATNLSSILDQPIGGGPE